MQKFMTLCLAILIFITIFSCTSTLSEDEYYTNATQAYAQNKYENAISSFELLVNNYPKGEKAAESSFMLGFINANDLKDLVAAEKFYKIFIEKYPDHELIKDAKFELMNLGKDINDLPFFENLGADSTES